MNLNLSTEQEDMLRQIAEVRGFESAEAFLQDALGEIVARETYFLENRDEIQEMIESGWQEAERGETLSAEEAKQQIAAWKTEALAKRTAA